MDNVAHSSKLIVHKGWEVEKKEGGKIRRCEDGKLRR